MLQWNDTHSWCPSESNALQNDIEAYDPNGNWAKLSDGTVFEPILKGLCFFICAKNKDTTSFIGKGDDDDNFGMSNVKSEVTQTIKDILESKPKYSKLVAALDKAGLLDALGGEGPFTLLGMLSTSLSCPKNFEPILRILMTSFVMHSTLSPK